MIQIVHHQIGRSHPEGYLPPKFTHLRAVEPKTLPAERYLGQCFDLVGHTANDAGGFTRRSVLDEKRIASNDPWSPFGRAITPYASCGRGIPSLVSSLMTAP